MSTPSLLLSKVSLRPTKTQDRSAPLLKGEMDQVNISTYQNAVLDINLESWINIIKDETFATELFPLTPSDARTFLKAYEELHVEKRSSLTEGVASEIMTIVEGLQQAIDRVRCNGPNAPADDCVFVKTSCRSAKDSTVFDSNFRSIYRTRLTASGRNPFCENDQIRSLLEAAVEVLKVRSASKLLLEVFCRSERVYQDLTLALEHLDRFEQHFIVRKWKTIDPGMEFRGFYHNGRLNALSQYNHLVLYPEVVAKKEAILAKIMAFFESKVQPKLEKSGNFPNGYVIDFALTTSSSSSLSSSSLEEEEEVWVIELNPFLYSTDACLFSWKDERHFLENGPFEFRVRTKELIGSRTLLGMDWRDVLERESKELNQEMKQKKTLA